MAVGRFGQASVPDRGATGAMSDDHPGRRAYVVIGGFGRERGDCTGSAEVFYDTAMTRRRMSMACRIGGGAVLSRHVARTPARS